MHFICSCKQVNNILSAKENLEITDLLAFFGESFSPGRLVGKLYNDSSTLISLESLMRSWNNSSHLLITFYTRTIKGKDQHRISTLKCTSTCQEPELKLNIKQLSADVVISFLICDAPILILIFNQLTNWPYCDQIIST